MRDVCINALVKSLARYLRPVPGYSFLTRELTLARSSLVVGEEEKSRWLSDVRAPRSTGLSHRGTTMDIPVPRTLEYVP